MTDPKGPLGKRPGGMAFKSLTPSPFRREGREKQQQVWSRADRPVVGRGCTRGWLVGEARVLGQRERERMCVCVALGLEVTAGEGQGEKTRKS